MEIIGNNESKIECITYALQRKENVRENMCGGTRFCKNNNINRHNPTQIKRRSIKQHSPTNPFRLALMIRPKRTLRHLTLHRPIHQQHDHTAKQRHATDGNDHNEPIHLRQGRVSANALGAIPPYPIAAPHWHGCGEADATFGVVGLVE